MGDGQSLFKGERSECAQEGLLMATAEDYTLRSGQHRSLNINTSFLKKLSIIEKIFCHDSYKTALYFIPSHKSQGRFLSQNFMCRGGWAVESEWKL